MNNSFQLPCLDDFIENSFQKKPYVFENLNYHSLVSWNEINSLFEKDILNYPRVRMANNSIPEMRGYGGFIRYSMSATGDKTPHINRYQLYKCLSDGATLIIDRCQSFFKNIDIARNWLAENLSCTSSANLYAAFTSNPSFGLHFDNHDVIAVQIEGTKRWEIHKPTRTYPLSTERSFDFDAPLTQPDIVIDLKPGQGLYLPAGYWHNVKTQTERSLHISFTVVRPRRFDLLKMYLDEVKGYDYVREPISFGSDVSDEKLISSILRDSIANFDINVMEFILKQELNKKQYIHIDLENFTD